MKYYLPKPAYREFFGHVFWNGKPVDLTGDHAALEAIQREPEFKLYKEAAHEPQKAQAVEQAPAKPEPVLAPKKVIPPKLCPKCGLVPGYFFHVKNCRGGSA